MVRERGRVGLAVAVSYAVAGGLLSAVGAIASLWLSDVRVPCTEYAPPIDRETWYSCTLDHPGGLVPEVADAYDRGWVVMLVALLVVPVLILALRLTRIRVTQVGPTSVRSEEPVEGRGPRGDRAGTLRAVLAGVAAIPLVYVPLWWGFPLWLVYPTRMWFLPRSVWPGLVAWPVVAVLLVAVAEVVVFRSPRRPLDRWGPRGKSGRARCPGTSLEVGAAGEAVRPGFSFRVLALAMVVAIGVAIYLPSVLLTLPLWIIVLAVLGVLGFIWASGEWAGRPEMPLGSRSVGLAVRPVTAFGVLVLLVIVAVDNYFYYPIFLWFIMFAVIGVAWTLGGPILAAAGLFLAKASNPGVAGTGRRLTAIQPQVAGAAGIFVVIGATLPVAGSVLFLAVEGDYRRIWVPDSLGLYTLAVVVALLTVVPGLLLLGLAVAQEVVDRRARREQLWVVLHTTLIAGFGGGMLIVWVREWDVPVLLAVTALTATVGLVATAAVPWLARLPAPSRRYR